MVIHENNTTISFPIIISLYFDIFNFSEKCYKLGTRGRDRKDCETKGGFYGCSDCASFAVRDNHCPVMCGICDRKLKGCLNS